MRKKRVYKKFTTPDPVYNRMDISRFTNYIMQDGKKTVAERVIKDTFDKIQKKTEQDPLTVFSKAIENVSPIVELVSRRVGGANYQIPTDVAPDRKFVLAARWIIKAARGKKGTSISHRLAEEIIAASNNEGSAIKKRTDTHKMAEANRAFAHFARFSKKKKS